MSSNKIPINPALLVWARERASLSQETLKKRFPKLADWELGETQPTLRQLEAFARAVYLPIGYFFLLEPIVEPLPIADFRTLANEPLPQPSANLLDLIYLCQQRQDWYRDYTLLQGIPPLDFIGTATLQMDPATVAQQIRQTLQLSLAERQKVGTWQEALRDLIDKTEAAGILIMISSIVGSNPHRPLTVNEFRGFTLADDRAPLIFINGADSKAAQMFTIGHELAHLWLGQSGVSNSEMGRPGNNQIERWCNSVAAELLVPLPAFLQAAHAAEPEVAEAVPQLARQFKVSSLVIIWRLRDAGLIDRPTFDALYDATLEKIKERKQGSGGDFYRTLGARTGKRFAQAVISSALEGQTLFRDAFRLLNIKKSATFYKAAHEQNCYPLEGSLHAK